ncbi:hypothetical protein LTR56_004987 [Elasticomyces elasticus]|nr:hypothetical protein LTR22_015802 [Elasticomyces elasticus]KAK3652693.1 hypothetical protein LTR56_004987 [Elasticomyces elasticus]KAK4914623.1 hypothetical protein LTR49_017190 [Elasticomyces elasticus]KAK5753989.1 hypothetical protein LTS12_015955 [Elasticomyces elasticus]
MAGGGSMGAGSNNKDLIGGVQDGQDAGLKSAPDLKSVEENAVVAFPNYVGKIQALGVKQSTFLIIVTYEPKGSRYTAGLGYQTLTGFKLMAHSEEKRTVMEALGGLLHVMAEGPAKDGRARMGGVKE